jgi:hypothetical protein
MGLPSPKCFDGLSAVPRNHDSEPSALQQPLEQDAAFFIVVNNQDAKLRLPRRHTQKRRFSTPTIG